ncbi:MAG: hypothetical protein SFU85_03530 [Candidatus Methylacidiphilales bacterium]|nr:hypothetical protein [Candidatus Methylacidiphilales bacterium]
MTGINRDELLLHIWEALTFLLFEPATHQAFLLYFFGGLLMLGLALAKAHGFGGAPFNSFWVGLFCAAFCLVGLLSTYGLLHLYLVPLLTAHIYRIPGLVIGTSMAFLLMVVPFTRFCFRSSYPTSLISWLAALLVAAIVIFGLKQAYSPRPTLPDLSVKGFDALTEQVEKTIRARIKGLPEP